MAIQERSFREIFGEETPEATLEVSYPSVRNTIYGAALLLSENPTEEAIADSIGYLATKSKDYLGMAYEVVWYGDEASSIKETDPLSLMRGVVAAANDVYEPGTDTRQLDFDPTTEAAFLFDNLQLRGKNEEWKEMDQRLSEEKDEANRLALAETSRERILQYLDTEEVTIEHNYRKVIPTWGNIASGNVEAKIAHRDSSTSLDSFTQLASNVQRIIERSELNEVLNELPQFDKEQFDKLRLQFGAKAANLLILQELTDKINFLLTDRVPDMNPIVIPEFIPIPVDVYKKWESGEDINEDLRPYFDWTTSLTVDGGGFYVDEPDRYIVRSSAVLSEDGETLSGAGIYKSVAVDHEDLGRFDVFKNAVTKVFASTNSDGARSYRDMHDIPSEEMGLVLQRLIPNRYARGSDDQHLVTVNSQAPGVPRLIEVVENGVRLFVNKTEIDRNLGSSIPHSAVHFRPDASKFDFGRGLRPDQLIDYAVFSTILERVWGGQIQLECAGKNILQIRRVTDAFPVEAIEFPEDEEIARGNGVGVGDKILKVLEPEEDNRGDEGLVQYWTNYAWTVKGDNNFLPSEGAVVVNSSGEGNAHLQTLCVENGLLCVYPSEKKEESEIPDLKVGTKVRVVSNGIEARIYKVPTEDDASLSEENSY